MRTKWLIRRFSAARICGYRIIEKVVGGGMRHRS